MRGHERVRGPRPSGQEAARVLCQLIELATGSGDLIVDQFMGVGSTAVAAAELGRRFAGCDVDEASVATVRRRHQAASPHAQLC